MGVFINSLSNCSNLIVVDIVVNMLRGMLPDHLGNFSVKFRNLNLADNYLYGTLPSSLGNLFSLTSLKLQRNQFTGTIPITIGKLQNLQMLYLDSNNLLGSIPDTIGNLSLLSELYLSYNQLEGTIPSSLGNCHKLELLSLQQNKLSGRIPKQIFQLSSLSIGLFLGRNHLSGPIPVEVGSLKNLGQLYLEENYLSGELPNTLGSCIVLETLHLGGNFFKGSISPSLGSLRALQYLNLSHNNFSGLIPKFFEEIPLLGLDISFNNFEGEVPMKGVFANSSAISVEGNRKLCGGMPTFQLPKCNLKDSKQPQRLSSVALKVVISVVSALLGLAIVLFLLFCWFIKKRNEQPSGLVLNESLLKVSYENLLKSTNGFSLENLIGVGAFASVYKGVLGEDGLIVAVKVLNLQHRGGFKSFVKECDALRHVRHRNLIKVITCCSSVDFQGNDFRALVYEFMQNGSLDRWLYSSPSTSNDASRFDLLQRITVAIDVACALEYLHHSSGLPIVHCDLKPSNILLDSDMVARVGDFGLAKLLLPENSNANTSASGIKGTIGYTPPEYGLGNEVSTNGDVYSYGILLLEMMIGKRPTDPLFQEGLNLHKHASSGIANFELAIVEPMLLNDNNEECLLSMLKIGVACSLESPQERMDIRLVIQELNALRRSVI